MRRAAVLGLLVTGCAMSPVPAPGTISFVLTSAPEVAASASPARAISPSPAGASAAPSVVPSSPAPTPSTTVSSGGGGSAGGGSNPAPATPGPTPAPIGLAPCAGTQPLAGLVATLAGGTYGYADGASAQFRSPRGLALAASGELYVADTGNRALRVVGLDGTVRTLAGGPAAPAFQEPAAVAVAPDGSLVVADTGRNRLYRVSASGTVTDLAGDGQPGAVDGPGASARFDDPRGLAVDAAGIVYVADLNNHRIRTVAADGTVATLAGSATVGSADGDGASASFTSPSGLALAPDGTLYVADVGAHAVRTLTAAGHVGTLAGGGGAGGADGTGAAARFDSPWAIAIDPAGLAYVVDGPQASRLRAITPAGVVTTVAGDATAGFQNGTSAQARFFSAFALVANGCGRLYLVDGFTRIREVH